MPETTSVLIGAGLTIAVLSYLIADNFLYRLAMHILVGVGAAYALGVAISQVFVPRLVDPLRSQSVGGYGLAFGLFGLLGCVFLLPKLLRRAAWLGNAAVGYMLGVGVGVAVGGALLGTLAPQILNSAVSLNPQAIGLGGFVVNVLILVSTLTTLLAFTYVRVARRSPLGWIGNLGRGFLTVAFGATFASVFITGASVLSAWLRDIYILLIGGG